MNLGALQDIELVLQTRNAIKSYEKWQYPARPKSNDKPKKKLKSVNFGKKQFFDKNRTNHVEKHYLSKNWFFQNLTLFKFFGGLSLLFGGAGYCHFSYDYISFISSYYLFCDN